MSSVFIKESGQKIRGPQGKYYEVPQYFQFVPGVVLDVVTSKKNGRLEASGAEPSRFQNTILAYPHIHDKNNKPRIQHILSGEPSAEQYRYKPLLRGMVDVPTKGDPVLLATFGGENYYFGPLNTNNDVNKPEDNFTIKDLAMTEVNEGAPSNIRGSTGGGYTRRNSSSRKQKSVNFPRTSHSRLHKYPNDSLDTKDFITPAFDDTFGDMLFEGRHGNSIRIGARSVHPYVYISNGRDEDKQQEGLGDGSLIAVIAKGTLTEHFGGFQVPLVNESGDTQGEEFLGPKSTFSGFRYASDTKYDNKRTMSKVISSLFLNSQKTRDNMYGYGASGKVTNQILINSDRVSLNSKRDDIYISSSESIHIGSGDYITLSSNRDLIIDSRQTMLGNPFSPSGQRLLMQPMVLGSELLEIIRDILKLLKFAGSNRYFPLPLGIMQGGEGAGGPLSAQIPPKEKNKYETSNQNNS